MNSFLAQKLTSQAIHKQIVLKFVLYSTDGSKPNHLLANYLACAYYGGIRREGLTIQLKGLRFLIMEFFDAGDWRTQDFCMFNNTEFSRIEQCQVFYVCLRLAKNTFLHYIPSDHKEDLMKKLNRFTF